MQTVFFVIALFVVWSDIRGNLVDVDRSSFRLINWRENKGGWHLLSRLFQTDRPPNAQMFLALFFRNFITTVVDTLRYNLSCLIKDRSALAELIRVLKYAKVSWTNFFNNQNVSKVPNRFNLFLKLTLLQIYKLAGRRMRYDSLRFPVEATRARVFVIGLLLSLQLGVLYR